MNQMTKEETATTERVFGVLVEWNDDRGFGWVEVQGKRSFAHIREFGIIGRRPKKGDEVSFLRGKDTKGRNCATDLKFKGRATGNSGMGIGNWIILFSLVLLPLVAGLQVATAPWILAAWLLMASRMSWLQYSFDKERAQAGMSRISEPTLLVADMLGGWPGGFVAQQKLRHKTRKWRYQFWYWSIVALWQWLTFEIVMGGVLLKLLRAKLGW